ncbi:MAG: hypothetical protein FJ271_25795 [Planctomycetes bacterium]|nr:hypothetical protein [Planctomycetota bacterium]
MSKYELTPVKVDFRLFGGQIASLAWVALRSFLGTLLVMALAGTVLAGLSYYFLRDTYWLYGVIAAMVAFIESLAAGFVFGAKRAVAMAAVHGLGKLQLGRWFVRLVFERMLGIVGAEESGERSGPIGEALKRLPLAQADELLCGAIGKVTGALNSVAGCSREFKRGYLRQSEHILSRDFARKVPCTRRHRLVEDERRTGANRGRSPDS